MASSFDSVLVVLYKRLLWYETNLHAGRYGSKGGPNKEDLPPYDELVGAINELKSVILVIEEQAKEK